MYQVIEIVRSIKAQDLPPEIQGPDIGEMLIQRRIEAIATFKAEFLSSQSSNQF